MNKLIHCLARLLMALSGLALMLMMLHVTLDVAGKYLYKRPVPGTAEVVAAYYMISVVFLPLACIELNRRSIVVEMLYDRLPLRWQKPLDLIASVISLAFFAFLTWLGIGLAQEAWQVQEYVDGLWRIVIWPSRFLIPIGMGAATLALLLRLVQQLRPSPGSQAGASQPPLGPKAAQ
ncbi:MAG: TRAP transporter small permease [Comamonadaceae bacterium]|nr:TRAP transporter small permease [Comamonadaceae bacterium]